MIRIENISKSFDGKVVIHNYSAEIPVGKTTCLMGPSGEGKTTLLRILSGLEKPDSGEIFGLYGKRVSMVFQEDRLCENLLAVTNIHMTAPLTITKQAILEAMEQIGLTDCSKQCVREFSGGMKRRTALLRALFAKYDILLLDEPFTGLDADSKDLVIAYLREHTVGKTVLLVAHDIEDARSLGAETFIRLT